MDAHVVDLSFVFAIYLLLRARHSGSLGQFALASTLLLGTYVAFSVYNPFVYLDPWITYESRALVPALVGIILICAVRPYFVWRFFQPIVAFVAAQLWLERCVSVG